MAPASLNLHNFAERYTAAWCSQNTGSVAACYSPNGSLSINNGTPAVGRNAITAAAHEFMSAFPDLQVLMDKLVIQDDFAIYRWSLIDTNTGPGGKGQRVRNYCNFAYSALASFNTGTSASASFHIPKKSW